MRIINGEPYNINSTLVGRLTSRHSILKNKRDLILFGDLKKIRKGYLALLTTEQDSYSGSNRLISSCRGLSNLRDNDIVSIDPNGSISQLYSSESKHNSLFLTERCNSKCIFCPQPPKKLEASKTGMNLRILELIKDPPETIGITGGEPTLIEDDFFNILANIQNRFPKTKVFILSNGIKFSNIDFTKRFVEVCSPNVMVEIPVYADYSRLHNDIVGTDTFYKSLEGIYNLAKFNVKIGIRNVISLMNYERLRNYSEFLYSNFPFVRQIAFMQMELEGFARANLKSVWIDPYDYTIQLEEAVRKLQIRGLNPIIYNFQLCILNEYLRRFAVKSITEWKNLFIDECDHCSLKKECPGFFKSVIDHPSRKIKAIA